MEIVSKFKDFLSSKKDKRWFIFLKDFLFRLKDDNIADTAAQVSYYLTLSIFPFLIFFLNILSLTPLADEDVLDKLLIVLPLESKLLIKNFVSEIVVSSSGTLLSLSILFAFWSASSGIVAIIKSISKAYDVENCHNPLELKLLSLVFTLGVSLLVLLVLTTLVFGQIIGVRIFGFFGFSTVFLRLWDIFRLIIPVLSMILMFALIYRFSLPRNSKLDLSLREALPGAVFTTLGWILSSNIFSYYVNNFGNYSNTYGSLVGVILLIIWLYLTSLLIILGGELNGSYKYLKDDGLLKRPE